MNSFEDDLSAAVAFHGHLCAGLVLGVRMARAGMGLLEAGCPRGGGLIVISECDRCPADALMSVTGCTLGSRRYKFFDFGKVAATFFDQATGRAVRLFCKSGISVPRGCDPTEFYGGYSDEDLFGVENVAVSFAPEDLPGRPVREVLCERCGEAIKDGREEKDGGKTLCIPCARGEGYYSLIHPTPTAF